MQKERFELSLEAAKKNIKVADHMVHVTYKVVNDPKLLLSVLENVFLAFSDAIGSILYLERLYKMIPPFRDSFESKFNMFRLRIVEKFKIDKKYINIMQITRDIVLEHKNSPVEFVKNNKLIICDDNYKTKVLEISDVKEIVQIAKNFVNLVDTIVRGRNVFYRRST